MSLIERAAKKLDQLRSAEAVAGRVPGSMPVNVPAAERPAIDGAPAKMPDALAAVPVVEGSVTPSPAPLSSPAKEDAVRAKRVYLNPSVMASSRLLTPDALRSQMAEEYRIIKRPLIDNATGKGAAPIRSGNLIMVSSALPREGKSFTALNLAISIAAELNSTVMLVDADVARPSVLNLLGLPPSPGLLDVLTQDVADVSDVLLRTSIENLSILPGGTAKEHATELLASEAMRKLVSAFCSTVSGCSFAPRRCVCAFHALSLVNSAAKCGSQKAM